MSKKQLLNANEYCLVTFNNTHNALHAEKILGDEGLSILVVPTPREVSAGCGLSIRFFCEDLEAVKERLHREALTFKAVYRVEKGEKSAIILS